MRNMNVMAVRIMKKRDYMKIVFIPFRHTSWRWSNPVLIPGKTHGEENIVVLSF